MHERKFTVIYIVTDSAQYEASPGSQDWVLCTNDLVLAERAFEDIQDPMRDQHLIKVSESGAYEILRESRAA